MLLGKAGGQLLTAPERMKQWDQLWMCLVMKVKSKVAKNSTAHEPGMLGL